MAPAGGSRLGRGAYVKSNQGEGLHSFSIDIIPIFAPKVAYVNSGERSAPWGLLIKIYSQYFQKMLRLSLGV